MTHADGAARPGRLAVFCPNLIGDAVMATPTLRALRNGWPGTRIVGVMKPAIAATLAGSGWFDSVIPFDPRSADKGRRATAVVRSLRAERCDAAILLPNSFRSALVATLAGIPRRIGYARGGRSLLLTDRLAAPVDASGRFLPTPAVTYYLAIARRLGMSIDSVKPELATTDDDERSADAVWTRLGLGVGRPVVCLNTGGAFGPAKDWPADHFITLTRLLVDEADADVLVVCGPAERAKARELAGRSGRDRVVSLADESPSIGLTKASLRRSALLITTDSGPRHFATAFGIPVVTLFGPTHIGWTRTYHPLALHLQVPVPCGPCQKPVCPEGHHRCMTELTPDAVFRAARRFLAAPDHARPAAVSASSLAPYPRLLLK